MNINMQSLTMNDGTVVEFDIGIDPDEAIKGNNKICTCGAWYRENDECFCIGWDDTEILSLFDYKTRISL